MTNEELDSAIIILQAVRDGRTVQAFSDDGWLRIAPAELEAFSISHVAKWRVKPEPREWWLDGDHLTGSRVDAYPTLRSAERKTSHPIRVREVLDDE